MRSNKEQLDIILERKKAAEAIRSKRRLQVYTSLSIVLCLCAVFAIVFVMRGGNGTDEKAPAFLESDKSENVIAGDTDQSLGESDNMVDSSNKNEQITDEASLSPLPPEYLEDCSEKEEMSVDEGEAEPDNDVYSDTTLLPPHISSDDCESIEETSSEIEFVPGGVADGTVNQKPQDEIEPPGDDVNEEGSPPPDGSPPPNSMPDMYQTVFPIQYDDKAIAFQKELSALEDNISYIEGRENMGLAMAWMLHIHGEDYLYHTVIQLDKFSLAGHYIGDGMYYFELNYQQVVDYALNGYKCLFVGTGLGNDEEISAFDKEGIEVYCQLYGDGFVAEKQMMY